MSSKLVRSPRAGLGIVACLAVAALAAPAAQAGTHSVARQWNEDLLFAIRNDLARPTVHARNLYHVSVAMWDAWAAYDPYADAVIASESATAKDVQAAREIAISYAAYRVLVHRFTNSVGAGASIPAFDARMGDLTLNPNDTTTVGDTPIAVGNRIGAAIIAFGAADNANEAGDYANIFYNPINPALIPTLPGNPSLIDANRWQPLSLDYFVDQAGNPIPFGYPEALSPEWGQVTAFALKNEDRTIYSRDGFDYWVFHDPGPPPLHGGVGDAEYKAGFEQVVEFSSKLDPADGVMIDISPASRGNNTLGTNDGTGYTVNPVTGQPYAPQLVPAGDYYRILAEFWADGPESETPPGHWFTIMNYVSDHQSLVKQIGGAG
ncbi:MAG: DUF6851 domain-containing protein, partial [Planctomycetota bacterium]